MICLDTNAAIAALSGRKPVVRQKLSSALNSGVRVCLPIVAYHELKFGIAKSARILENERLLELFLSEGVGLLDFEPGDAIAAADIRAKLETAGTPIGPYDLLIAAQSLRRRAILITANTREFVRVVGLPLEDWEND